MFTMNYQGGYSNSATRHEWAVSPDGQRFLLRAPNVGARGGGGLVTAPMTFTPAGATTAGAPASNAPANVPNFGLTVVLDWPAAVKRGGK
jgi:hypothetical protein